MEEYSNSLAFISPLSKIFLPSKTTIYKVKDYINDCYDEKVNNSEYI